MPVSHNLWSVFVSSYWLRNTLVLPICHAVTLNKILFVFISFTSYLHLQQNRSYPNCLCAYLQKTNQTFKNYIHMQRTAIAGAAVKTEKWNSCYSHSN